MSPPASVRRSPRFPDDRKRKTTSEDGADTDHPKPPPATPRRHHIKLWIDGEVCEFKSVSSEKVQAVILLLAAQEVSDYVDITSDGSGDEDGLEDVELGGERNDGDADCGCNDCGINEIATPKLRRGTNGPIKGCHTCEHERSKSKSNGIVKDPLESTQNALSAPAPEGRSNTSEAEAVQPGLTTAANSHDSS